MSSPPNNGLLRYSGLNCTSKSSPAVSSTDVLLTEISDRLESPLPENALETADQMVMNAGHLAEILRASPYPAS